MIDYFIRTQQSERQALLDLGVLLGVIRLNLAGRYVGVSPHVWHEIGAIRKPTGALAQNGAPVTELVMGADGQPAWHANQRFMGEGLMKHAQAVYAANPSPALAAAIGQFGRYFVTDPATGDATQPSKPAFVFA